MHDEIDYRKLLEPPTMLKLYSLGAFPMADSKTGIIEWSFPQVRTVIPLNKHNIPRSLRKFLDTSDFEYRFDTNFPAVVKHCADRDVTWISDELIDAYMRLYKRGFIHTVEIYQRHKLVGGLYGVAYKGAFFGESMFSLVPQASKAALTKLIEHLNEKGFMLLDVQYMTEHLRMFGAVEIPWDEYSDLLTKAYRFDVKYL